jgi:hypothetical protein
MTPEERETVYQQFLKMPARSAVSAVIAPPIVNDLGIRLGEIPMAIAS